ncbi:kinase-like domain-containing protein [Chytriomyces sp. MP71]|nr:kinase-like domain-containing protein [Chytriomyces sp. MP71]
MAITSSLPRAAPYTTKPVNKQAMSNEAPTNMASVIVAPALAAQAASAANSSQLYGRLSSEDKARLAVVNAVAFNPELFLTKYTLRRIIGFGSNGVCLAAVDNSNRAVVSVKLIYKSHIDAAFETTVPKEIQALRYFSAATPSPFLLKYISDSQDTHHFIVITELFGCDWMATVKESADAKLAPLTFTSVYKTVTIHELDFTSGSSDLWAWAYAHRDHMWETEGHSLLPLNPVKSIIHQMAEGLSVMHSEGWYHGDIKVENALVNATTYKVSVRLIDFGHAKLASSGIKNYGTQEVSPPEFLADSPFVERQIDGRAADVFALGIILCSLLNEDGELPAVCKDVREGRMGYCDLVSSHGGLLPLDGLVDLDNEGWDLISGMTLVDPAQRLTIQEVLDHPWFAQ